MPPRDQDERLFDAYVDGLEERLGMIHKEKGNPDLAKRTWQKAIALESDFAKVSKGLLPKLK